MLPRASLSPARPQATKGEPDFAESTALAAHSGKIRRRRADRRRRGPARRPYRPAAPDDVATCSALTTENDREEC